MTDSLSQCCLNCEAQANTIEELRAANERWAIAFNQAEERAIDAVKALQADKEKLREAVKEIKDAWDWWQVDTYDRLGSRGAWICPPASMTTHHPEREDATGAYPGSCTCAAIKRREALDNLFASDADLIDVEESNHD